MEDVDKWVNAILEKLVDRKRDRRKGEIDVLTAGFGERSYQDYINKCIIWK